MCRSGKVQGYNKCKKYASWLIIIITINGVLQAYYRDAVGGFVVYDVTQRVSLEHCLQWKKDIDDVVQLSNGDPIPIVLIANKVCMK